jgi:chromosome segregation ATPase
VKLTSDRLIVVLLAALMLTMAMSAGAGLYKWTDDKGVVHYGDKIPPEYANRASSVLSKQGVTVKKNEAALTPEQLRQRDEALARERDAARALAEQQRKESALLNSYANEQEIEVLKARALKQVDQSIAGTEAQIADLQMKKAKLETEKTGYLKTPPPEGLLREIAATNKEIARHREVIEARRKEMDQIAAKYDGDKQRYLEIKAKQAAQEAKPAAQGSTAKSGATATASAPVAGARKAP